MARNFLIIFFSLETWSAHEGADKHKIGFANSYEQGLNWEKFYLQTNRKRPYIRQLPIIRCIAGAIGQNFKLTYYQSGSRFDAYGAIHRRRITGFLFSAMRWSRLSQIMSQ